MLRSKGKALSARGRYGGEGVSTLSTHPAPTPQLGGHTAPDEGGNPTLLLPRTQRCLKPISSSTAHEGTETTLCLAECVPRTLRHDLFGPLPSREGARPWKGTEEKGPAPSPFQGILSTQRRASTSRDAGSLTSVSPASRAMEGFHC